MGKYAIFDSRFRAIGLLTVSLCGYQSEPRPASNWRRFCMSRRINHAVLGATIAMALLSWHATAMAQSPAAKPKSPGEIAAASQILAQKSEACRQQARALKIGFFKRRLFMHRCLHPKH
jgi:hypothetical protein